MDFYHKTKDLCASYIKENLTPILILIGLTSILLGGIFNASLNNWVIPNLGEILLKSGGAILGAGVFAAIMKSAQFTDVFQKHIGDVFFNPENIATVDEMKTRWSLLTDSILRTTLPNSHQDARSAIMKHFFCEDLPYHFEGTEITLDITSDPEKPNVIKINHNSSYDIVISPGKEIPTLEQVFCGEGDCKLTSLIINESDEDLDQYLTEEVDGNRIFRLPLHSFQPRKNANGDLTIRLDRTLEIEQDISQEPFVIGTLERYTKGFNIRAKIDSGQIVLHKTGPGSGHQREVKPIHADGQGYTRWQLAEPSELMFPGQGYILVLTKCDEKTKEGI